MDTLNHLQNTLPNALLPVAAVPASIQSPPTGGDTNHATVVDPLRAKALKKARDQILRAMSRKFGNIPGVPIFTVWGKRMQCSDAAVHRCLMAGICGNKVEGVYSIVLSSLYLDDEDGGDIILYTGAGGREKWTNDNPPKRLRCGPQTMDQSWDHPSNKALIVSFHTGNPVRVVRSWRCGSQYSPSKGYRYDGLYKVASYWTAKGRNGKNICRCRLERLPDQVPIPLRPVTLCTRKYRARRLVSHSHGGIGEGSRGLPNVPRRREGSDASTLIDFNSEVDQSKEKELLSSPPQRSVSLDPVATAWLQTLGLDLSRNEPVSDSGPPSQPQIPEDLSGMDDDSELESKEEEQVDAEVTIVEEQSTST